MSEWKSFDRGVEGVGRIFGLFATTDMVTNFDVILNKILHRHDSSIFISGQAFRYLGRW